MVGGDAGGDAGLVMAVWMVRRGVDGDGGLGLTSRRSAGESKIHIAVGGSLRANSLSARRSQKPNTLPVGFKSDPSGIFLIARSERN